jgi:hypothetical protein
MTDPFTYLHQCVQTLNELQQRSANIPIVRRLSGEIQMGHTPPFAETTTVWRWLSIPDRRLGCARLEAVPNSVYFVLC